MPKEEYEEYEDQDREEDATADSDPAVAPALSAGLGAVYLRNKLKAAREN